MAKYRKKPVEIEAVRITAADYIHPDCWPDGAPFTELPLWLADAIINGTVEAVGVDADYAEWDIHTLEGVMRAGPDDYLIQGVKGEIYPCKADIFAITYDSL